jgi:hypothetical protein
MKTCAEQVDCLGFNITKVDADACSSTGDTCEFVVCLELQLGGSCTKSASDTVSHTCEKAGNVCLNGGSFGDAAETKLLEDGYSACQRVMSGGKAEFLMKDSSGTCGTSGTTFGDDGTSATCQALEQTLPSFKSCTGNENMECVWTIEVPDCGDTGSDTGNAPAPGDDSPIGTSSIADEEEYLCA